LPCDPLLFRDSQSLTPRLRRQTVVDGELAGMLAVCLARAAGSDAGGTALPNAARATNGRIPSFANRLSVHVQHCAVMTYPNLTM
jgi:hypothetical protein